MPDKEKRPETAPAMMPERTAPEMAERRPVEEAKKEVKTAPAAAPEKKKESSYGGT